MALNLEKFTSVYQSLNEKQQEAVDTIYGSVLVIAWPWSGKTQLLSARIAHILATTDYLPSNILCLTFTENAAKNMRERLASIIWQDAYKVAIHTFHSFGNDILNRFRYLAREYNDAKPVDSIESSKILDGILLELPWDNPYRPWFRASDTIKEVLGNIGNLKKWGITPELYKTILDSNKEIISLLNPLIEQYWWWIDSLWQKKEDKEKKISLFKEFTNKVQELNFINQWFESYENFWVLFIRELEISWESYEWDGGTKFLTAWRDAWTSKNYQGKRELKETAKIMKQEALIDIFTKYQSELKKRGLIDFNDMILETLRLIKTNDVVRMTLAETYQFIMIDEFQDTNEAQMQLINSILSVNMEWANIFAVWDDDQSIYKFQWANTKSIRDFHDIYTDTRLIILEKNYRSKHEIITESRAIIQSESNNIGNIFPWANKKFDAIRQTGWLVRKKRFKNELEELSWIIHDIAEKISFGVNPHDIAVITKKNKTLELIGKWLLEKGINIHLSKTESIFDNDVIILILNILKFLHSTHADYKEENAELLVSILSHPCFKIHRLIFWNISKNIYHARKETTKSWIETLTKHEDETIRNIWNFLKELSIRAYTERLEDIIDYITGANELHLPDDYDEDGKSNPLQIDMFSWERKDFISPIYNYFFAGGISESWNIHYARHLTNIRQFIESVRSYKNGKSFITLIDSIEIIRLIEKYDLDITTSHIIGNEWQAVELITVYKAKWLEWEHVYVPCIHKKEYKLGKIAGSSLPKNLPLEADKDGDDDIERLVYTAYTRAKDTLTISYSAVTLDEKSLEPLACIWAENDSWEEDICIPLVSLTETLEAEKKELFSLHYLWGEKDFLRERIEKNFVMNATALQGFLNIADAGPEYFVSNTLLRFPQAKNIAASYGSAIHKALEDFLSDYSGNKSYKKQILFDSFEESLKKEWFDINTETTYLERGRENLEAIYTEITGKTYGELFLEYDFRTAHGGTFLPVNEENAIQLTGKIDRIEKLPDDSLIITDYKTGGGFDIFDGRWAEYEKIKQWKYRLQLCFYAILFEHSPRWKMYSKKQYELFFVEKNREEDRFHRVFEYIQQGEIERTKKLIIAVIQKIEALDFPDVSKFPKTLEWIRMFEEELIEWCSTSSHV
mgnify:FL=1